jgi:hypothetical protein
MLRQQHVTCEGIATFPDRDDERGIDLQPERLLAFADLLRRTGHPQSPPNNASPRLPHYTPRASRLATTAMGRDCVKTQAFNLSVESPS